MLMESFPLLAQQLGHQALPAGLSNQNGFSVNRRGHDRVNPASIDMQSVGASSYSKGMNNPTWLPWRLQEEPEPEKLSSSLQERNRRARAGPGPAPEAPGQRAASVC